MMNFTLAGFDIRCQDDRGIVQTNIYFRIKVIDSIPMIVSIYLLEWNIAILTTKFILVYNFIIIAIFITQNKNN